MVIIIECRDELLELAKASKTIVSETGAELKAIATFYVEMILLNMVDCGEDYGDIVAALDQLSDNVCDDLDCVGGVSANLETAEAVRNLGLKLTEELFDIGYNSGDFTRMKMQGWCDKFSPIIEVL